MTVLRHEMSVSLKLESPFITRGMVVDQASIDMPLAVNADEKEILPATLVKGVIRGALKCLAEKVPAIKVEIATLLGSESQQRKGKTRDDRSVSNDPDRGCLLFEDFVIDDTDLHRLSSEKASYARIQVDRETGSVQEGFLAFVGMPFPIGMQVPFQGVLRLLPCGVTPERARQLVTAALHLVPAVGAMKSAGFGKVSAPDVGEPKPVILGTRPDSAVQFDVTWEVDRPAAVGGMMKSDNLFAGDRVLPGGAIKGCMAQNLKCAGMLDAGMNKLLAAMTVGHAFPVLKDADLPLRHLSLSLAVSGEYVVDFLGGKDALELPLEGVPARWAFSSDWKSRDWMLIEDEFGQKWDDLDFDVRTRTAIDPQKGSAAYDTDTKSGKVFSIAAVENKGIHWKGRLIFPNGSDGDARASVLALLDKGMVGLGKTSATLYSASIEPDNNVDKGRRGRLTPPYALTLQTPAVLNDPERLSQGYSLASDYAAYWDSQGFRLIDFFASQHLEGGYIALRYPPRDDRIEPWLLTDAGSVFLVEPKNPDDRIDDLLRLGLPPATWLNDCSWEKFPFGRENGYGQVMLNAIDHSAYAKPARVAS